MAWEKIAETNSHTELHDTWKFELYQDVDSEPASINTIILNTDFKLRRGNPSAKNKFQRILNTVVDFQVLDMDKYLIDVLRSGTEYEFKGVILKNGSTYFAGYITLMLDKLLYKRENLDVGIKVYDGLNRLKEFTDLTQIGTDRISLKEIVRTIFNALNLNLDINAYQNIFTGSDESDPDARALWLTYFKMEDFINTLGKTASYYELLTTLADMFDWNVFQENGVWVLRQNASVKHVTNTAIDGIWKETVVYSNGNYDSTKVDLDSAIDNDDLRADPISFEFNKLDKVELTMQTHSSGQKEKMQNEVDHYGWTNPFFLLGNQGWTTNNGSPDYREDSVYMDSGDEIQQESSSIPYGWEVNIKLSAAAVRMILDASDELTAVQNKFFRIKLRDPLNIYGPYYLRSDTFQWTATFDDTSIFGKAMPGIIIESDYVEEYQTAEFELDIDIRVNPPQIIPYYLLSVICYGGGSASGNNYPFEQGSIINFAILTRKNLQWGVPADEPAESVPNEFRLISYVSDAKEFKRISLPFADYNPYNGATIWYLEKTITPAETDYLRAYNWSPDSKMLIEHITERIIKQNRSRRGFDINLLPGKTLRFVNLIEADFESEGSESYFLPVYEESLLIRDHKRFVLLEHNFDSPSITTKHEFIFPNSTQQ